MRQAQRWAGALSLAAFLAITPLGGIPAADETAAQDSGAVDSEPCETCVDDLWALVDEGKYAEAATGARDLLARVEAESGPDSTRTADVLAVLVGALWRGGKESETETLELVDRALKIRETHFGESDIGVAWMLCEKSNVLQARGEYAAAEPVLLRALQIYSDLQGPDDPDTAGMHNNLGNLYERTGQIDKAREHLEKALAIYEASSGPKSLDVADALNNLASVARTPADAEELYRRSMATREELLGPEHPQVAGSYQNLGYMKWEMGEYDAARPLMERAIAIQEKTLGPDHPELGGSLLNLGILMMFVGETDRAEESLRRSISILEKAGHPAVAGGYAMYALFLGGKGDLLAARQHHERALEVLERTEGPGSPRFAWTLNNLGDVHAELGEYDRARECFARCSAITEASSGSEDPTCVSSLAGLEAETGNFVEAIELARRAVAMTKETAGDESPQVINRLYDLGKILQMSRDYSRARAVFEQALAIERRTSGGDSYSVTSSISLADLDADEGDCSKAVPAYRRAISEVESLHDPDHPQVGDLRHKLAGCLARLGRNVEAFDNALRAESMSREHLRVTLTGLAQRLGLQYAATRDARLHLVISILNDDPSAVSAARGFDAVIRSRALVLDEMAERWRTISAEEGSEVSLLVHDLKKARNRLAYLAVKSPPEPEDFERHQRLLAHARVERDRLERELAEKSRGFRLRQENKDAGLNEAAAALPPRSGLVGYARFERSVFDRRDNRDTAKVRQVPSYAAFVLTREQREPSFVPLGDAERIEDLVNRMRGRVAEQSEAPEWGARQALAAYRDDAELLRRRIWDPIESHLAGLERLFVVPDGALHLVNFAALPVGDREYVIERGPKLHYLSAERDLVLEHQELAGEGLLVVGNPDFEETNLFAALAPVEPKAIAQVPGDGSTDRIIYRGSRSACDDLQTLEFDELTGTEAEARDVIALWRKGNEAGQRATPGTGRESVALLSRGKASETAFKLNAPGRRVLHLATHGFFLGGSCPDPTTVESPLLRTGLVMAGANHRQAAGPDEDDGILTAEEVAALDLGGVEWAVLSACETGLGEVRAGEGVLGLRRAFGVAGARTLIISLWRVEDEPTGEWMKLLYERRFVDGLATADAVHRASLEHLRQRREAGLSSHPFYWAGFVAAGDWR
jgi:CHAT domain-containing protein/tetratricopeptide (TPR) repeat protein